MVIGRVVRLNVGIVSQNSFPVADLSTFSSNVDLYYLYNLDLACLSKVSYEGKRFNFNKPVN